MDDQLPPPVLLYQLAHGHYVSQAIYVAATLGIADLLSDGPRGADDLARSTRTDTASLRRVLRLLASAGVLRETDDGTFDLTPVGTSLRSGPGSFRAVAQLFASPAVWASWGDLLRTVRTGEAAWHMMVCTGGRQRSEAEFRSLFQAAGFQLTRIVPTLAMSSVIEGKTA